MIKSLSKNKIFHQQHSTFVFFIQTIAFISFTYLFWIPLEKLYITALVYFLITCIGGTITYHRLLSHKSFKTNKIIKYFGVLCGVWGAYGSPLAWVAIHRKHHRYADTEKDPHSPLFKKWWQVQWLSIFENVNLSYVPDLRKDKFLRFLHKNYGRIHLIIWLVLILIDPAAFLYAYLWPAFLVWNLASLVNTLGHQFGYRNFEVNDNSKNNWWLAILVFGEGWHNNHHRYPTRFTFKEKWWEFDISEWIIRLIRIK